MASAKYGNLFQYLKKKGLSERLYKEKKRLCEICQKVRVRLKIRVLVLGGQGEGWHSASMNCSPRKRKRGSSKSATLLLFLDTPAAIILLHPLKVVPKVWYSVGIDLIEAPTTSQNGNRFLLSRRCKRPLYKLCDSLLCVK